ASLHPPPPHSFPTRRSSDLSQRRVDPIGGPRMDTEADCAITPHAVHQAQRYRILNCCLCVTVAVAFKCELSRSQPRIMNREGDRSEERTSELQSPDHLVCRL